MKNIDKRNSGITLIALVVTIIVLLILASITLRMLTNSGLMGKAEDATFATRMGALAEEYQLYKADALADALFNNRSVPVINAGEILREINENEEYELNVDDESIKDIKEVLKSITSKEENSLMVYNDELYYVKRSEDDEKAKICEQLGIKVFEYFEEELVGIKLTNGSYQNINGLYMCVPEFGQFSKYNTRYVKMNNSGYLVPDNWINKRPPDDWYDYKNQKWANIYIENSGLSSFFVWIPRYVYKQDTVNSTSGNERMDVKFVNTDNEYIDGITEEKITWTELQAQGYVLPEAFEFAENILPGYWISKYQLSDFTTNSTYPVYFETVSTPSNITIKNLASGSNEITRFEYAINGKVVHTSNNPDNYEFNNLATGNKAINVTGLDVNGQIVGSFTYLFKVAEINPPDVSKFDPDTTFYVYYDNDGNEHNEIPVSKAAPKGWYDYTISYWANIVTRNNGLETYYVWIPRYEYQLNPTTQRSYVNFIKGTSTETTAGYTIPEAFTFGGQELTGYWITKYQLSIEESTPNMDAEMSAGSNIIRIREITGTKVTTGLKYEYYLNGEKKHEGEDPLENYAFINLNANTTYTINIIARNKSTNAFVAAVTKKIKTISANAPDISKFDLSTTFYVTYDDQGNETRTPLTSGEPSNWYDYTSRKWANIVTTANSTSTYWVWVPRYEYRILSDRANLSTSNRRIEVNFLSGTDTHVTSAGFAIPEAFTFGGQELTGYWITKYQLN